MLIVSEHFGLVIAVDTHAATHTLVAVEARTGGAGAAVSFPTSRAGLRRAVAWVDRQADGQDQAMVLVAVEGVGSYGATFARLLGEAGYQVVEAPTVPYGVQYGKGKSDTLDAVRIARATLALDVQELRLPRRDDGPRAALRVLRTARDQMNGERTRAINALTALLRTTDLGVDLRRSLTKTQLRTVVAWRTRPSDDIAAATARSEAVRLATQILLLDEQLKHNQTSITAQVKALAPDLLQLLGVGPVVAASILIAWSHPGRVRSEAALASLAGTSPIPASSGKTVRHRLNRGGDRTLNNAMYTIAITRMRVDEQTKTYVARRMAEGKTKKDATRLLKRYITRQIYRFLNNPAHSNTIATVSSSEHEHQLEPLQTAA